MVLDAYQALLIQANAPQISQPDGFSNLDLFPGGSAHSESYVMAAHFAPDLTIQATLAMMYRRSMPLGLGSPSVVFLAFCTRPPAPLLLAAQLHRACHQRIHCHQCD